jgi:hypothetical protein
MRIGKKGSELKAHQQFERWKKLRRIHGGLNTYFVD